MDEINRAEEERIGRSGEKKMYRFSNVNMPKVELIAQLAQQQNPSPIDTAQNTDYDNQNTTGGDNNGTRPFDPGTQTDRATTEGFESIIPKTSTEIANRFSVQTGLGSNTETSPHIRADERQRTGLDSQNERFPPHSYIQVPIGSPIRDNQEIFRNNGIECRIVDPAYWDKDGMAFTNTEIVYVNPNIDSVTLSTLVPHETCHVMKQNGSAPYMDFILRTPEMLNFKAELAMLVKLIKEELPAATCPLPFPEGARSQKATPLTRL